MQLPRPQLGIWAFQFSPDDVRALTPLQAASCTYRVALGPRAGQKVLSLQSLAQGHPVPSTACHRFGDNVSNGFVSYNRKFDLVGSVDIVSGCDAIAPNHKRVLLRAGDSAHRMALGAQRRSHRRCAALSRSVRVDCRVGLRWNAGVDLTRSAPGGGSSDTMQWRFLLCLDHPWIVGLCGALRDKVTHRPFD